jgi:hypothetical protein
VGEVAGGVVFSGDAWAERRLGRFDGGSGLAQLRQTFVDRSHIAQGASLMPVVDVIVS